MTVTDSEDSLRGACKDSQSSNYFKASLTRRKDALTIIHQEQISMKLKREGNRVSFAFIKFLHRRVMSTDGLANIDSFGWLGNPVFHRK